MIIIINFNLWETMKKDISIKSKIFAHVEIWRPYTVIWCGLVSLVGASLTLGFFPPFKIALLATITPIIGWIAALYACDFFDKKLDSIQKPHRPLPSGRVKPIEMVLFATILAIIGSYLAFLLGVYNLLLSGLVAISVIFYTKFLKSNGIFGHLNRGFITWMAFLFGAIAVNKTIPPYVFLISLVFPIHDTTSNILGAIRDIDGDRKGGYITIPVKYGTKNSVYISLTMTAIWSSFAILLPLYFNLVSSIYFLILTPGLLLIIIMYIYVFKNFNTLSREQALIAHEIFAIERIMLASAFIFGVSDFLLAIFILIISMGLTVSFQYPMRKRYEFGQEENAKVIIVTKHIFNR